MSKDRIRRLRKAKRRAEAKRMRSTFNALPNDSRVYRYNPGLAKWEISKWHNNRKLTYRTVSSWSSISIGGYKLTTLGSPIMVTGKGASTMLILFSAIFWQVCIPMYLICNS